MTTQAPPKPLELPAPDQPTEALQSWDEEVIKDAVGLLDHRTRRRLTSSRLAPRGPCLALGNGEETLVHALEAKITHIGRGSTASLRIDEQRVSRDHAIIVRHGRYARLLDNRSSNGTFLNGRRVVATNLRDGDVIRIGPVLMQYIELGY